MSEESFKSISPHLLVAAFDFGTSYSGYAFSFRSKPLQIQTNKVWNAGSEMLISLKTPTCVLLKPDKQFQSFGYDAENEYAELALDDNHHEWYLFRQFKMMLHDKKDLTRKTTIEDINRKPMNAKTIFALSIQYMRGHLLKSLENQASGISDTDIQYVLTVPAIWNDGAKQFMREAAVEAGIDTNRLKIALEPEAASIWCQTIAEEANLALSSTGNQYMLVDLGGGTADISVHELKSDGTLKEVHKASGGAWGGTEVDNNYISMMTNLVGEDAMKRYKKEQMGDYFDMMRDFEVKKRTITSEKQGEIIFKVAASLLEICEKNGNNLNHCIARSDLNAQILLTGDKLRVDAVVVKDWFKTPIECLLCHVKGLFAVSALNMVDTIVLVGGFSECQLVQEAIKSNYQNKKIIIPHETELAVLKGAVTFGHMPTIISTRILQYTYGKYSTIDFDPTIHPESKLQILEDGRKRCKGIFKIIARAGDSVDIRNKIHVKSTNKTPLSASFNHAYINMFCSENVDIFYVTDPGCRYLGKLRVDLPERTNVQEKYDITYTFGDTELIVKAKRRTTGEEFKTSIDCL